MHTSTHIICGQVSQQYIDACWDIDDNEEFLDHAKDVHQRSRKINLRENVVRWACFTQTHKGRVPTGEWRHNSASAHLYDVQDAKGCAADAFYSSHSVCESRRSLASTAAPGARRARDALVVKATVPRQEGISRVVKSAEHAGRSVFSTEKVIPSPPPLRLIPGGQLSLPAAPRPHMYLATAKQVVTGTNKRDSSRGSAEVAKGAGTPPVGKAVGGQGSTGATLHAETEQATSVGHPQQSSRRGFSQRLGPPPQSHGRSSTSWCRSQPA